MILISNVKECFCGNTPPAEEDLTKESACNQKCPGDSSKICGASWRMNVYETGDHDNQKDLRFNQSKCSKHRIREWVGHDSRAVL